MKYYFDVKETFIKTVAVDADNLEIAEQRLKNAYKREEFEIEHNICDDVEFKEIPEGELLTDEMDEVETLNCSELIFDPELDGYVCSVCNTFIISRDSERDLDCDIPDCCPECGTSIE